METINTESVEQVTDNKFKKLNTVTKISKYLAMILFITLPFLGGWVGYQYATDKMMGVEKQIVTTTTPNEQSSLEDKKRVIAIRPNDTSSSYLKTYTFADTEYVLTQTEFISKFDNNQYTGKLYKQIPYENGHTESRQILDSSELPEKMKIFVPLSFNSGSNLVRIGYSSCLNCGTNYPSDAIVELSKDYQPGKTLNTVDLGDIALFEWTGDREFRFKHWPKVGDPEYIYIEHDRENPEVACGMFGCPIENIDWTNIKWESGQI